MPSRAAAILDVDGTLVDSVYQHALCWQRALAEHELWVPAWRCHRGVGMGGDQIVVALAGEEAEREHGDALREREDELFAEQIDGVRPLEGARDLVERLADRGHGVVLASSGSESDVTHYIDLLDLDGLLAGYTTSADVDATKPHPDVISSALGKVDASSGILVGDTVWDVEAANRAGIPCIGLLTGGFGEGELLAAGAEAVFDSPGELVERLDRTSLG